MASTDELLEEVGIALLMVRNVAGRDLTRSTARSGQTSKLGVVSGTSTCLLPVGFFTLVLASRHGRILWVQRKQSDSVCSRKEKRRVKQPKLPTLLPYYLSESVSLDLICTDFY